MILRYGGGNCDTQDDEDEGSSPQGGVNRNWQVGCGKIESSAEALLVVQAICLFPTKIFTPSAGRINFW